MLTEDLDLSYKLQKSVSDMGPTFAAKVNNINSTEILMEINDGNRVSAHFVEVPK